ncbi:MAG: pentapeptide repeat-containing protein, partial [Alphaproteobacteria bacterium]|nr:pentapeptide repeat-containing protein [Alphaproteobacteria bacterium]MDX5369972.1 pentapeptide repeat-containing protein [Alphaproteobacteria bacterium]MDX5464548.1 pentapeptide repeat-containing protein [Alphaproteobacteria bacterium]
MLCAGAGPVLAAECKRAPRPGIDWSECARTNLILSGADLARAKLDRADFTLTDLSGSTLTSASLEKTTLVRASLAGATADDANFRKVEAYRANFSRLSAQRANFRSAELQRTDFSGADLTGADFEKAEMGRAVFDGAILKDVRFDFANLARADLRKAKLSGRIDLSHAFLFLTRIEGVDLTGVTGLEQGQLDIACGDADTRLPPGLSAPADWPCA